MSGSSGSSRRSPSDLGGLLEAAPDAMVVIDQSGTIVLVNAQTEQVFGYTRAELLGRKVEILVPLDLHGAHRAHRSGYIVEPHVRSMGSGIDLRARRKDGSEFPVEISLAPLETEDGVLVSAAVRDITERRRIQADADRVKDEFFATVSHELRTPLTSILGYAELMADLEPLTDQGARFLQVITRSAERELRLVDDLLTLVAIQGSGLRIQLDSIDVVGAVRDAVEAARPLSEEVGIELSLQAPEEPVAIQGDLDRIGQAVDNLLSNALKFTPREGRVQVAVILDPGTVAIEVADSGMGIGESNPNRIFERLYRSGAAVAQQVPGAGLGLTISLAIVEAHHGTVEVVKSDQDGTTVRITLPLPTVAKTPRRGRDATAGRHLGSGRRVRGALVSDG